MASHGQQTALLPHAIHRRVAGPNTSRLEFPPIGGVTLRYVRGGILTALAIILTVTLSVPLGPVPAILPLLNPGQGIWSGAQDAAAPLGGSMHLAGLRAPVRVVYSAGGVPHIFAQNDHDLFYTLGYLEARDRLFQMDLMRRQGEGKLAAVLGPSLIPADKTELGYGLIVGAQRTLREMQGTPAGRATLTDMQSFSDGVNRRIQQDIAGHDLPIYFKLIGYTPSDWTPLDTLAVQEDMEQDLALSMTPLDMAVMVQRLGPKLADELFPTDPADPQHPYDTTQYRGNPIAPLPPVAVSQDTARAASTVLSQASSAKGFFAGALDGMEMSNNWVVSGKLTKSGYPILSGDPHLSLTLPAIWYEFQMKDPHYDVTGVGIPGAPIVLIGHNQNIAWSLTDTQDQTAFFYVERTSPKHPGQYLFNGRWHPMQRRVYDIAVAGQAPIRYVVDWTNNGPILTSRGQTVAMRWTAQMASPDIQALAGIDRAQNLSEFEQALSVWVCPNQNFAFADRQGDIAIMAPGLYPQLPKASNPALPMDGSGGNEWIGAIPARDVPETIDPKSGYAASANQREVRNSYPYYIGSAWDFFSTGYRADTIYAYLANSSHRPFTIQSMEKLQADNQDHLAMLLAPDIAQAGSHLGFSPAIASAVQGMSSWPGTMVRGSVQATIYWYFLQNYLNDTFGPWWQKYHIPAKKNPDLQLNYDFTPLVEDLEAWTLEHGRTPTDFFNDPITGQHRTAADVMRQALSGAIAQLQKQLGPDPAKWQWGRIHFRAFNSLTGIPALGRGPYSSDGDFYTPDAAQPSLTATSGPSWRMVVDLGNLGSAVGVYTGGQSENPVSPDYANFLPVWRAYRYQPLIFWQSPPASQRAAVYEP